MLDQVSADLTAKYGRDFSTTNLRYFRTFFTVYAERAPEVFHLECGELDSVER